MPSNMVFFLCLTRARILTKLIAWRGYKEHALDELRIISELDLIKQLLTFTLSIIFSVFDTIQQLSLFS